jgi:hypothetical protein
MRVKLSGFRGALAAGVTLFRLASLLLFAAFFARALAWLIAGFLTSIVGYVPATALEMKTIDRHQPLQSAAAMGAVIQGWIREFLQGLSYLTASAAFIFVNRHSFSPPTN